MENSRIKVIYIAGWGRSGSTILDRILGQIDGFFSIGEMRYVWDRNLIENRMCGCGVPFNQCEVWTSVFRKAFGGFDVVDPHEMVRLRESSTRTRHIPLMLLPGGRKVLSNKLALYLQTLRELYKAVAEATGAEVIVDSSKFPSYGFVLQMISSIDLYVVHLVRDPRAVAYSWLRKKLQPDTGELLPMKMLGKFVSSSLWLTWNVVTELIWRHSPQHYMFLKYEDFVRRPEESVERIVKMVGYSKVKLPFVDQHTVKLGVNHTVSGNPVRFQTGLVEIRPDEEWQTGMRLFDKLCVRSLTWPLLSRYGYT